MESSKRQTAGDDGNGKLALALWRWGLPAMAVLAFAVAIAHLFSMFQVAGAGLIADKSDGALKYLGFAVLALVILRAGTLLKAKFAGIELEFASSIADHANHQEATIQQLKTDIFDLKNKILQDQDVGAKMSGIDGKAHPPASISKQQMPELGAITAKDDINKGRFGGRETGNGYRLSADFRFKRYDDPIVTVVLHVSRDDNGPMDRPVRFFLHETFGDRKEMTVSPSDGKISVELLVYGGFTVGAWIVGTATLLELDLAKERMAPSVIRNL